MPVDARINDVVATWRTAFQATTNFIASRVTVAVNVTLHDIASARARLSVSTKVAQRPNMEAQVATRWRSELLPGFLYSSGTALYQSVVAVLLCHSFRSLFVRTPSRTVSFCLPFSDTLAPLLEAYRVIWCAPSHEGLNSVCVHSPQLPVPLRYTT